MVELTGMNGTVWFVVRVADVAGKAAVAATISDALVEVFRASVISNCCALVIGEHCNNGY